MFIWSQGLAFHYQNLLDSLAEKATAAEQEAILKDIWSFVAAKADAQGRRRRSASTRTRTWSV